MTHVHFPLFGPFFDLQGLQVASWPHGVTKITCMVHNNNQQHTAPVLSLFQFSPKMGALLSTQIQNDHQKCLRRKMASKYEND
jgi:hypothetical protein